MKDYDDTYLCYACANGLLGIVNQRFCQLMNKKA